MTAGEQKRLYDAICKEIIAEKYIEAHILKACAKEFADISVKDIATRHIEGNPAVATVPVVKSALTTKVSGINAETHAADVTAATFDVVTTVLLPPENNPSQMIINFEAQNDSYPGYPLIKRSIFYASSIIHDQYGKIFIKSQYNKLRKVYSIWICTQPPQKEQYTITSYSLKEYNIYGEYKENPQNFDLLEIVIIRLGKKRYTELNGIFRLLNALFLDRMNPTELKNILESEYAIQITPDLEKGVEEMCNLSEGIYAQGISQGISQERENFAISMLRDHMPIDVIVKHSKLTKERVEKLAEMNRVV